jgi:hypothetical protein
VFMCGVCNDGTTMRSASTAGGVTGPKRPTYRCRAGAHLARVAEPVDELITALVLARLGRADARLLLTPDTTTDTADLSTEAAALRVRLDELATLFAEGAVTGRQLSEGTAKIRARLGEVETDMATAAAGSPLFGFADADDIEAAWNTATVSRRKAVIGALVAVTLLPARRGRRPGGHYFDPDSVRVEWKVT